MNNTKSLSVIIPALNEEKTIENVVRGVAAECVSRGVEYEIIVVNDGSTDGTGELAAKLAADGALCVKKIDHRQAMGIGCSFRDGLQVAAKQTVTWLPADGENEIGDLLNYLQLLNYVDIVIPFVINKGVRSWMRRLISSVYLFAVNMSFGTNFNYTNGNVLYNRRVLESFKIKSNGFFFQAECLIKAIRLGYIFAEVPVFIKERAGSASKALKIMNMFDVFKEFMRLVVRVHILGVAGKYKDER